MELEGYLARIGFEGGIKPDLECLTKIHRCHALNVPYENLDVQLERPVDQDVARIYEKIVNGRRGGWCYEQNGLLGWALREAGFDVKRVTGAMMRHQYGDRTIGNHVLLLVKLDQTYIADLGVGDGNREPLPLVECEHRQGELTFRLEKIDDGYWRFHNHAMAYPTKFDFSEDPADEQLIERKSQALQIDPESIFVQNLVCQIMRENTIICLTGKVMRQKTQDGTEKTMISSADELARTLVDVFGIEDSDAKSLWPKVQARHAELFGDQVLDDIEISGM